MQEHVVGQALRAGHVVADDDGGDLVLLLGEGDHVVDLAMPRDRKLEADAEPMQRWMVGAQQLHPGGHPAHGEMALDQLFLARPMLGWGRYRGPLPGLYMCGAGTHPGGGVTGGPAANAAREILAELR